jgi:hypothetical protein
MPVIAKGNRRQAGLASSFLVRMCDIAARRNRRTDILMLLFLQTFTWKTDQQADLARVFALNEQFMRVASSNPPPPKTFTRPKKSRPMKAKAAGGVAKKKGKE